MSSYVLGVSYGYHDSAAALLRDGHIVAAAQEERFSRVKHDPRFPANALRYCLREAGIALGDVQSLYYYENPGKKLARIAATCLNFGLRGFRSIVTEFPDWISEKVHVKRQLRSHLAEHFANAARYPEIDYLDHHESHAAAAFFPSPFEHAAVLCVDGVGEWATTTAWSGSANALKPLWEIRFPHSLGLLYSAMTWFCGFKVDSGEYKLMGLAPYGEPSYERQILGELIELKPDGSFWLNMEYFDHAVGDCMVSDKFAQLFGGPRRGPEGPITQREFDLAASIQLVLEQAILRLARSLRSQTGHKRLCLAGGVALNCVANGKLLAERIFKDIWVQPAAGDSGGALGAALAGWHVRMARRAPRPAPTACSRRCSALRMTTRRSRRCCVPKALCIRGSPRPSCAPRSRACWPMETSSAGSRGAWNSARVPWGRGPSSATRAIQRRKAS